MIGQDDLVCGTAETSYNDRGGQRDFDLVTSQAVIDELSRGRFPGREDALKLVKGWNCGKEIDDERGQSD